MENEIKKNKPEAEASNPFADLSKLRMSQDFADEIGVEKLITKIRVGKPDNQWFVRVHKDPAYRIETALIKLKNQQEYYLVAPHLWEATAREHFRGVIFTGINRQGVLFLWVIALPGLDGKLHDSHKSAMIAATTAMDCWVRITWNKNLMDYEVGKSKAQLEDPKFPDKPFGELLKIGFLNEGRYIDSLDHPVLKELRGEV